MIAKYNKCYTPAFRDDFFNDFVSGRYYGRGYASTPAVNIIDEKDEYRIEVAAAGLSKKDFKIDLDNNMLTVSAERKEDKRESKDNFTRREFNYGSFKRSFEMNDKINMDLIKAEHRDGILSIHLPKKEESLKPEPKSIEIK